MMDIEKEEKIRSKIETIIIEPIVCIICFVVGVIPYMVPVVIFTYAMVQYSETNTNTEQVATTQQTINIEVYEDNTYIISGTGEKTAHISFQSYTDINEKADGELNLVYTSENTIVRYITKEGEAQVPEGYSEILAEVYENTIVYFADTSEKGAVLDIKEHRDKLKEGNIRLIDTSNKRIITYQYKSGQLIL